MREFKNILDVDIIKKLINFFWTNKDLHHNTNGMSKIDGPWQGITKKLLEPVLSNILDTRNNLGDNYFYHKYSYLPHVDYHKKESYNVLIPLELENTMDDQYFIIFDQLFLHEGRTFCGNLKIPEFSSNKIYKGKIKNEDASKLTNEDINLQFYQTYLQNEKRPLDLFWGLSGTAFKWVPGNVIVFNSRHIHCTGNMNCDAKLGLSLRFKQNDRSND